MKSSSSFGFSLLFLLAFKCGFLFAQSQNDVFALTAFKRAIFEDPFSVLSDWNTVNGNPCNWYGVICSQHQVISLILSNSSLKGFLAPEIGQLNSLQELHLDSNLFLGSIPKQIGLLKNLTILDLSSNRLTGPIPSELGNLTKIIKINFHSNGLSGTIPGEFGKLANLVELRLDRNRLKGIIPGGSNSSFSHKEEVTASTNGNGLCEQSSRLKVADFSYNFLIGKIPSCLKHLPRTSFQGNCFQDGFSVLQRTFKICSGGYVKSHPAGKGLNKHSYKESHGNRIIKQPVWILILEIITGVLILVFIFTVIFTASKIWKAKKNNVKMFWQRAPSWREEISVSIDGELLNSVPRLTRQELENACEDFSNIIGSSEVSLVYKGTLKGGPEIAVISLCICQDGWLNYHEFFFQNKLADLARLNHENVAKFLGYCKETDPFTRMVVFEYASNGTLYEHLHCLDGEEGSHLSWARRMKVAIGIAKGLQYLHTELNPPFAFADLDSNAVHVTEDFTPKLVDFECWNMMFSNSEKNPNQSSVHGFPGSSEERNIDVQMNTFSFGVILLEIISGRLAYCKDTGCLIEWAAKHLQNPDEIPKLVDPNLTHFKTEDLQVICSAVSLCLEPDPLKRPSMQIIAGILENGIDLSVAAQLKACPLAWAELALSS